MRSSFTAQLKHDFSLKQISENRGMVMWPVPGDQPIREELLRDVAQATYSSDVPPTDIHLPNYTTLKEVQKNYKMIINNK